MRNLSHWKIEAPGTMSFCGAVLLAALSGVAHAATPSVASAPTAVTTVSQSVVTIGRDGSRREFSRQIKLSTRQVTKVAPASPSSKMKTATAAATLGQSGPGRSKPNVVPGYPSATINSQNFGSVAVGGTSSTITLTYPYPSGVTTQNLTFAAGLNGFAGQATCNYPSPCTAPISFTPVYPGLTTNAVISKDQNGNIIYETLLYATGTAPQLGFDLGDLTVNTGFTNQPDSVAVGPDGNYYITDASQNAVYKFTPSSGSSGQLDISGLGAPGGIAVDGAGTIYIADKTKNKIVAFSEANGAQTTLSTSTLSNPNGVGVDGTGAIYVADTGNNRIIKIDNQGTETTLASGIISPTSLALDSLGDVFFADDQNDGEVTELPAQGGSSISIATGLGTLYDIAVDAGGRIYISTPNGDTLISPDGTRVGYGGGANYGMAVDLAGNVITTQPGSSSIAITNRSASNFILTTQVGTTTTGGDTISNTGNTPLTLSNLAISGTVFSKDNSSVCLNGSVIQPGQKCDFSVDFAPPAAQSYQETYTATSNTLNVAGSTNGDVLAGYGTGVPTTESLNINPNPVITGQSVEFIGTVSRSGTGVSGTTNGSTNFYDGTTLLGTVSQANGAAYAMYFTSTLAAGTHSITAKYNGDTINGASTSPAQTLLVTAGAASTTTLSSTPNTPRQGQVVTFQVAVASGPSTHVQPTPTGTVTLMNTATTPATVLGTAPLASDGTATLKYSKLPVGNASVVATYNGDANFGTSQSAVDSFGVAAALQSETTLTVTPTNVAYQTPVTLSATVKAGDSNLGYGQVYFCDAAAAQCSLTANLGIAQIGIDTPAELKLAPGTIGTHNFTATFVPLPGILTSVSDPQTVTVTGKYPSATAFDANGSGGNYTVTGTVVSTGSNTVAPTGVVSFLDTSNSNSVLGSVGLGSGALAFSAVQPAAGPNSTGSGSYGQAAGDFNGDGFQDIAVGNYEENSVSILLGKGDGTFQPEVKYNVGTEPERLLVADLNGDGKLDLIVANTGSGSIGVLLGNGDGTFQAQVSYECASPVGLGVLDINGDGYPDVVVGDYYSNTMSVLLGNKDGTLQQAVTYPTGNTPQTIAEGDFNGDGVVDVVVGNNGDSTVGIFLGNGDGTFQQMVTYAVGNGPQGVQAGDFNGDGKLDLAVTNHEDGTISVLLGNGDGTFQTQVTYAVGGQPVGLVIADFNGDGKEDISVGNTAQSSLTESILLGNGDGTFQEQLTYGTGNFPYGESVADFNGDGFPDIGVSNFSDGTATVLLSQVTETSTGTRNLTIGGSSDAQHAVEASYAGDANVSASVSETTNLAGGGTVAAAQSATTLAITPAAPTAGQSVTFTVAVIGTEQVTPVPTGTVTLTNTAVTPAATLGMITLNAGSGSFSTSSLAPGNYTVVASYSGDSSYQASASTAQTLTIAKSAQTISFGALANRTYGAASFALSATASSGLAVTYTVTGPATVTGSTLAITGVGQVIVTAAQAGNTTYAAATSVSQSFTVAKAVLTATASNVSRAFGAANPTLTYTTAGFVNGDTASVIGGAATLATTATTTSPVGSYPITFTTQALTAANYSFTYVPGTLTVQGGAAQTITFPTIPNHTLGDAPFTLSATASSGLAVSYAVISGPATVAGSVVTLTGVGTVTIQATQGGNTSYAAATPVSQSFTVSPAAVPTLSGLSPVGAVAGSSATTITLTGTNFTTTDQVKVNTTVLATTYGNATTLTAVIPANLLTAAGTLPVTVTDTASGNSSTVASFLIEVAPVVVFTGPTTAASGDQPVVTFQLKQPYAVPINCLLTLTFAPTTSTGIDDPAVQFSSGGRTINVTLPAGSTTTPDVQFQAGTVAGTVTVTLTITADNVNVTPANVAPVVVVLPTVVPQISAAKMTITTTSLTVTMTGFSNTREVKSAIFHFTPTPGSTISNPDVTIDVSAIFAGWYSSAASNPYGSTFTYTQPFNLSEDATTIQGVTVTLVNAVGNSVVTTAAK